MAENLMGDLSRVVDELVKLGAPIEISHLTKLAEQIGRGFETKADEVAILALSPDGRFLKFLVPEKLQHVGNIPMTSATALAVRTARDKRPEMINNFTTSRHTSVFEAVPLGDQRGDPIQKIMSVPVSLENKLLGVVQVSRKGKTLGTAGPDFTPKDLNALVAVAGVLGRCLKLCGVATQQ